MWLIFFISIQGWIFNRYFRVKNAALEAEGKFKSLFELAQGVFLVIDTEGRVLDVSGKAENLFARARVELLNSKLFQLADEKESERLINFIREVIQKKESGLDDVTLAGKRNVPIAVDIRGRLIDNFEASEEEGIFLNIVERIRGKEQFNSEGIPVEVMQEKLDAERGRIAESARQEEARKFEEAIKALEQKYLESMGSRLAEERGKLEEAIRQEEMKKAQEKIRELEAKSLELAEIKFQQERVKVEEAVRQEEAKKTQDAQKALEQKYIEILRVRVAEEQKKAEEAARLEEQKKAQEQIQEAEAKFLKEAEVKISECRKLIEESVRQEERGKAEESAKAVRIKYEELFRKGIEEERKRIEEVVREQERKNTQEQIRLLEAKHIEECSEKLAQQRGRIEEAVRKEEVWRSQEAIKSLEEKHQEILRQRLTEECSKVEEAVRQEEKKNAQEKILALQGMNSESVEAKIASERAQIEERVRWEEEKKAQEALKTLEREYTEAINAAARKSLEVSVSAQALPDGAKNMGITSVISGVGQQVMNPLFAVLNNLKLIKIKLIQDGAFSVNELMETINFIEDNALLCKNILAFLSDPARGPKAVFQPVSLNDVIAKIDSFLGQELKLQNISFQKLLQADLPNISGDMLLLVQVVFNLIANAEWSIKSNIYVSAGSIIVKTQSSPRRDFVELSIADNGIGISQDNLLRVFEPFFSTSPDGLGLGLTIVDNIIREHKGEIKIESKDGNGAV
ncbi:MAG: ATP-binding protein, partial [Candidatus Omnitrophota bacterium]